MRTRTANRLVPDHAVGHLGSHSLRVAVTAAAIVAGLLPWSLVGTVAAAPVTTTFSYAGAPVAISDGVGAEAPGASVSASLNSSGLTGTITDVDFRIDGATCNTTAGSTTVGLDHTFVGDLVLSLTSPDGTTVTVINRLSSGGGGNSGNNFCQTILNDEAATPIQSQLASGAPFTGSFTPANALSAFDGETSNGTWQLSAQDFFVGDVGSIRAFSVIITTNPGASLSATKTVAGGFMPGDNITYTVVLTNNGATTQGDNPGNEFVDVVPATVAIDAFGATASAGTTTTTFFTNTVSWNGTIAPGGTVTITIPGTVGAAAGGTVVSNQGTVNYDSDDNGTNDASALSDDPSVGGAADPTSFTVDAAPMVTVDQAAGQADPTSASPIQFTAVFSEAVTGFTAADVVLGGTAGATTASISGAGPTYTISVTGMGPTGTVTATIPAGAATDGTGNTSLASTSTDNTVSWIFVAPPEPAPPPPPPRPTITLATSTPTITWGQTVTITATFGSGGAGRAFQLLGSLDGVTFSPIATGTTATDGTATVPYRPATNLFYRISFPGASDLGAATSNTERVVVRQVALLRPTNAGATKTIARNTAVRFTTTVRPARPELPKGTVTFFFYHRVRGSWELVAQPVVSVNSAGQASWTLTFEASGSWYVRSRANPTTHNANSVLSRVERYEVR